MRKIISFPLWGLLFIIAGCLTACQTKVSPANQQTLNAIQGTNGTLSNDSSTRLSTLGHLISAYAVLGYSDSNYAITWTSAPDNWIYGSVCADDSHKGSDPSDGGDVAYLENTTETPTNTSLGDVWRARYTGVKLANAVLRDLRKPTDMNADDTTEMGAEARFLRGYYHFDMKKIFGNVPYIDENAVFNGDTITVTNALDIWPNIEADLQYAYNKLPETQANLGRVNKWAAAAYLAKAYVYQRKWTEALALFHTIIAQGVNSQGLRYALLPNFADNFNPEKNHQNDPELVFAVEYIVNDGTGGAHGNQGDILNFPYIGGPGGCCSFNQPSFSLVNAFKVDNTAGLPLISTSGDTYNSTDLKNDQGVLSQSAYSPDATTPVDPRLDWTVGRRGIPYLDWGVMPGQSWIRNQSSSGPYSPLKTVYYKSQQGIYTETDGWATNEITANNTMLMRYADVLLMAAEAEVEVGSMEIAQQLVNRVRTRAANLAGWVKNSPAHYMIGLYPAGYFTSKGQAYARKAVQFERRLELAMEGHRFFDLVRYGTANFEINSYYSHELNKGVSVLNGAHFVAGKSERFPIPQFAIDRSNINGIVLYQNPGY